MQNILKAYAKNMKREDITCFIKNKGISASDEEIDVVFNHIKKYCDVFFDNPIHYIKMLKGKVSDDNYYQILMLFDQYKGFLK